MIKLYSHGLNDTKDLGGGGRGISELIFSLVLHLFDKSVFSLLIGLAAQK